jgi:ATPase subunit of ABC transporter with duplicated ATPase domains
MSATLIAKDLAAGHGDRVLFSGLELVVAPGDVLGLVGVNGAGKSTLLRTLAGLQPVENGTIGLNPPTATVGYLPQEPERRAGETVREFLARRTGVDQASRVFADATEAMATGRPGAEDDYAAALERWLGLGGADLDERAEQVAAELGLAVDLDQTMTTLSGGQAARAGLASLLLSRYDVFLLDEPTNDLDLDGLSRLEHFVGGLRAATVLVSHDREFLRRTVNRILELDLAQQQVRHYGGGYAAYLEEREVARRHDRQDYEEYAQTHAGLEARARTQRAWMEKGVKNARRKAPDNDKVGRKFRTEATEKQAAKARQTERLIERLEVVEEPRKEWELRMQIAVAPRTDRASRRCWRPCSGGSRWTPGTPRWAPVWWSARSTRPVACSGASGRCWRRSRRRCRRCPRRRCAPCWPSSACARRTCCVPPARCRPASGPARPSRCSRPGG